MAKQNSFVGDEGNSKAQVTELKVRPGLEDKYTPMYSYIPPLKLLALERGEGQEFLNETSFLRSGEELPPPPSPFLIDPVLMELQDKMESIESQLIQTNEKWQVANRNHNFYMLFSLILMVFFLFTGLLCLGISLKLPPLAGLVEKLEEFLEEAGKGTDMTTVIPILIPDNFIAGSGVMRLVGFLTSLHTGVPDFSFNRPQFLILVTNRPNFSYF